MNPAWMSLGKTTSLLTVTCTKQPPPPSLSRESIPVIHQVHKPPHPHPYLPIPPQSPPQSRRHPRSGLLRLDMVIHIVGEGLVVEGVGRYGIPGGRLLRLFGDALRTQLREALLASAEGSEGRKPRTKPKGFKPFDPHRVGPELNTASPALNTAVSQMCPGSWIYSYIH